MAKNYTRAVNDVLNLSDTIEVSSPQIELLEKTLQTFDKVKSIEKDTGLLLVTMHEDLNAADLNEFLVEKGIVVSHLAMRKRSLEEQFLELLTQNK